MIYMPPHFEVTDTSAVADLIVQHPLGTLVTTSGDGIAANHIPFVLDQRSGEHGRLLGHVARNNDVWRDHGDDNDSLVIFQSAEAYISPNWYPTKQETHEVVPTWNYAVVHVYGRIIVHDDPKWIRGQAGMLTRQQEAQQPKPWKMADAPPSYIQSRLDDIVGIEIPIGRIIAKFKASQNRTDVDRAGAIAGLRDLGAEGGNSMASIMEDQSSWLVAAADVEFQG